jgi:hypothetical protein
MRELPQPRMTAIFKRGVYTDPTTPVTATTPAVFKNAAQGPPNRLTLGKWLASRDNPLAARVTVNRWWAELFGQGIVSTLEDFGIKGAPPSHPELLDWLAVEFMESGWDMKHVLKLIVMSETYRQSSEFVVRASARPGSLSGGLKPELQTDPANTLLSHFPRFRLDAETIRDNALSIAGLLNLKQGGVPIRPPQPDGLWSKVGGQQYSYETSPGSEKHRRGLYVVLKRGSPYPSFVNFDASARMACVVRRSRSNTPLQALTLLNDPVYVEAAKHFALRIAKESPSSDLDAQIAHAFRLALARSPSDNEAEVLKNLWETQFAAAEADAKTTKELIADVTLPKELSPAQFSAFYSLATALLNLDECITKP